MKFNKIYTGKGADGTTALWKGGRVSKSSINVRTVGKLDSLSAFLGSLDYPDEPRRDLQQALQSIMSRVMSKRENYVDEAVTMSDHLTSLKLRMENQAAVLDSLCPEGQKGWVYYGDVKASVPYHLACTACREAESDLVELTEHLQASAVIEKDIEYVNMLSKYLYLLARDKEVRDEKKT